MLAVKWIVVLDGRSVSTYVLICKHKRMAAMKLNIACCEYRKQQACIYSVSLMSHVFVFTAYDTSCPQSCKTPILPYSDVLGITVLFYGFDFFEPSDISLFSYCLLPVCLILISFLHYVTPPDIHSSAVLFLLLLIVHVFLSFLPCTSTFPCLGFQFYTFASCTLPSNFYCHSCISPIFVILSCIIELSHVVSACDFPSCLMSHFCPSSLLTVRPFTSFLPSVWWCFQISIFFFHHSPPSLTSHKDLWHFDVEFVNLSW
jgi:hypothetical protein